MMELNGLPPAYAAGELAVDKQRKTEMDTGALYRNGALTQTQPDTLVRSGNGTPFPYQAVSQAVQDYSTFQFQAAPATTNAFQMNRFAATAQPAFANNPQQQQQATLMSALLQPFQAGVERIVAQIAGFYFGNRREKPLDDEKHQRALNDFFSPDLSGERKVQQTQQGGFEQSPE